MGGIDTSDMVVYSYLNERRTVKYWKKSMLQCIFSNAAKFVHPVQRKYDSWFETNVSFGLQYQNYRISG